MLDSRHAIVLGTLLLATFDVAAQERLGGSRAKGDYFEVEFDFESPKFAALAVKLADRAWEAGAELLGKPGARPRSRCRIELREDEEEHAKAVRKSSLGGRRPPDGFMERVSSTFTTVRHGMGLLADEDLSHAEREAWGCYGIAASRVIEMSASVVSLEVGGMSSWWLREGIEAWITARMLGARDQAARASHPYLSMSPYLTWCVARDQSLPKVEDLMTWSTRAGGADIACMRELFFMMMNRHPQETRQLLSKVNRGFGLSSKRLLKRLKAALGKDVDLDAEFREHCSSLTPEWIGSFRSRSYVGPPEALLLAGGAGFPIKVTLARAQPLESPDYEIAGKLRILDRKKKVGVLQFVENRVATRWATPIPRPVVSVVFHADGKVSVLREQRRSEAAQTMTSARGPKLSLDRAHAF
ncbi:MAG: hypothetical protein ACYST0_03960, partial [Planctomycetota bacterium]